MAKLINRYALFDAIRNITYNSKDADAFFEEVLEVITEQPTTTEAEIRAKAIDEFAEKLSLEISESIIWGMVVTAHRDGNCSETSDEIVEYVLDTVREIAEQLKEE